jgi:hypothetical protein
MTTPVRSASDGAGNGVSLVLSHALRANMQMKVRSQVVPGRQGHIRTGVQVRQRGALATADQIIGQAGAGKHGP